MITVPRPIKRCHCNLPEGSNAAKIPDLNPVENLFSIIENEVKEHGGALGWPKNKDELRKRIISICENIPKSWFKSVFESLPNRRRQCVKLRGDMTDYFRSKYS